MFASAKDLPQMYTLIGNVPSVINGMPEITEGKSIPVYLKVNSTGTYTLTADFAEFNPSVKVSLHDLELGLIHDLNSNPEYTFNTENTGELNRFVLEFRPSLIHGIVHYDNTLKTPLAGVQLELKNTNGDLLEETISAADGSYHFKSFPSEELQISAVSNATTGSINSIDALLVLKHFSQLSTLTGMKLLAADANENNIINAVDALFIQKFFVGYISHFPASDWIFEPVNIPVMQPGEQLTRNIKGIARGDTNGDYIP